MAKIVILSGAGISAESGIKTFRDGDGLWNEHKIEDICTDGCLERNRKATIEFYNERRIELKDKLPNHAHKTIAKLKDKYPNEIAVITQNVDDMFEKAGCSDVIHLHGFLRNIICMRNTCNYKIDIGYTSMEVEQRCPKCNKTLRPDIVFFEEEAPMYKTLFKELKDCNFFVVIGTSGAVLSMESMINRKMKKRILNNMEQSMYIRDRLFDLSLYEPATKAIDTIEKEIEKFLEDN